MLTHPIGYASYTVPVRRYRYLQSGLLQCLDRSKPPCHLLKLRSVTSAFKRLSLSGFLLLRTIFTIQGTHNRFYASAAGRLKQSTTYLYSAFVRAGRSLLSGSFYLEQVNKNVLRFNADVVLLPHLHKAERWAQLFRDTALISKRP